MRINIKIDPYIYPVLIIAAFVIGFILAIALGFTPQHGEHNRGGRGAVLPALVEILPPGDWEAG